MIRPKKPSPKSLVEIANFLKIAVDSKIEVTGICSDSRLVEPGDLFLALSGERSHGVNFLETALQRGARAILTDTEGSSLASAKSSSVPLLVDSKLRSNWAELSDWFYSSPSSKMKLYGITGTNGKTTTSYLLHQMWTTANIKPTGLIGTVAIFAGDEHWEAERTTPSSDQLERILARMVEENINQAVMEVSSHALVQDRVKKVRFSAVGFTNLSQDHLDYHKNMENYYLAKKLLFSHEYSETAFVNIDNEYGKRLISEITINAKSLSISGKADGNVKEFRRVNGSYQIEISSKEGNSISGMVPLLGRHNLENLLLAVAMASNSGMSDAQIAPTLSKLTGAPGRLELVIGEPFLAFVDYAHTPDAVSRILDSIRELKVGRIIGVLGCGGDRDRGKRPLMGEALNSGCDLPIFTSDNPRSENADDILKEMTYGLSLKAGAEIISDRRAAISRAVAIAKEGDLIIVLGKGHEEGQEILGKKLPFSDREELIKAVAGND
ncbi:MAG: UDP-N-acetylmuramoyl-L-alanyl-D-glutamate--2,6-diaminopimelate ligase [Actinomycetales bacterium]